MLNCYKNEKVNKLLRSSETHLIGFKRIHLQNRRFNWLAQRSNKQKTKHKEQTIKPS